MRGAARGGALTIGILWLWLWQGLFALLAANAAGLLVRGVLAGDPQGDAALARAGSLVLLALSERSRDAVRAIALTSTLLLVVGSVTSVVPLAVVLAALEARRMSFARAVAVGVRRVPTLLVLALLFRGVQACLAAMGVAFGALLASGLHTGLGEARATGVGVLGGSVFAASALLLDVPYDLSRAASVGARLGARRAIVAGIAGLFRAPGRVLGAWAWRGILSLGLAALGIALGAPLSSRGLLVVLTALALHQAALLGRVLLRASWLAVATEAVRDAALVARRY